LWGPRHANTFLSEVAECKLQLQLIEACAKLRGARYAKPEFLGEALDV